MVGALPKMSELAESLGLFRAWTEPRLCKDDEGEFLLGCFVDPEPASSAEMADVTETGLAPSEAFELWAQCRSARLCEAVESHQWGLAMLSPPEAVRLSAEWRGILSEYLRSDDFIIGQLIGDQEFLVISPSELPDYRLMVSLPLDERGEWYPVSGSLADFLARYYEAEGQNIGSRFRTPLGLPGPSSSEAAPLGPPRWWLGRALG
jgi:hypothetical protein